MTEQVQEALAEVDSAPAPEATAVSDSASLTPDVADEASDQTADERKFSQTELDAAISKRLAREQRKWEREQQARAVEMQARRATPKEIPPVDQFSSPEAYAEALAVKKAEEMIAMREHQREQAAVLDAFHEREEEARAKYDDFQEVAYNPQLRVTDVMAETIRSSDNGPDIAYWLGSNPKEADRISRLPPLLQAREIGKVEAKLSSNPLQKKTSSAPAPIKPGGARALGNPSYDTTDPRSVKSMSTSDWIEAERARQMRKMQAQMSR